MNKDSVQYCDLHIVKVMKYHVHEQYEALFNVCSEITCGRRTEI